MRHLLLAPPLLFASASLAQDTCAIDGFAPVTERVDLDARTAAWTAEAQALVPFGAAATLDLDAAELHATVTGTALTAPSTLATLASAGVSFTIADAVVEGVGAGSVEVRGIATLAGATLDDAALTQVDVIGGALSLRADTIAATFAGATLTGYTSATLIDASGTSTALPASITLTSAGAVTSIGVLVATTDRVAVDAEAFALAGDFTAGTVAVEGELFTTARTLLGVDAAFAFDGAGVVGAARVTQAFDDERPLMQADVEVTVLAPVAAVPAGGALNVPALVRNRSPRAVAILAGIEVDGCGASAVTPVVEDTPPSLVVVLIDVIEQSGWAAPFVAIAVAPLIGVAIVGEAFVAIADAFVDAIGDIFCGLFGCDDGDPPPEPVPPVPYPQWLEPGQVAYFEIALLPQLAEDDYPVRVRFLGKNHAEAHVDFTLRVGRGDAPSTWRCGYEAYGTLDGCHCGCGALDTDCPAGATIDACDVDACSPGFNHLEEADLTTCVDDPVPPPVDVGDDDDDDDDDERFDCAQASPAPACAAVLFALALRRRRRA